MLTLLLGGARSGKSALAVRLAAAAPAPVVVIATAEGLDGEMAARIDRHRTERPAGWRTIEEPLALESALGQAPDGATVILDCLTMWTSNMLAVHPAHEVRERAGTAALAAAARPGLTLAISNEVGMGIVPDNELARAYRDLLGHVNARWAAVADSAHLLVAGRLLSLEPAEPLVREAGR